MFADITNDPRLVLSTLALAVGFFSLCVLMGTWGYVFWLRNRKQRFVYQVNLNFGESPTVVHKPIYPTERYYSYRPGIEYKNWQGTTHVSALWDASEISLKENFRRQSLGASLALLRTMPPSSRLRILNNLHLNKKIHDQLLSELGM